MDEMSFCGHSLKHHCLRLRLMIFENINDTVNDGFMSLLKRLVTWWRVSTILNTPLCLRRVYIEFYNGFKRVGYFQNQPMN